MRILLWGTYDTGKPRSRILIQGMRESGIEVSEIHAHVWSGVEDKSQVQGMHRRFRLAAKIVLAYPRLLWRLARAPKPDLVLVGYPGVLDVLLAAPILRLRRIPLVWDVFISLFDTVVEDRALVRKGSFAARFLYRIERRALLCTRLNFLDTATHARRIENLFGLSPRSVGHVWVGAEVERFRSESHMQASLHRDARMHVLFYGQFIPLHGISTIIEAARLLKDAPISWIIVGRGQEAARIRANLDASPLPSVKWVEWVPYDQLSGWISRADLCLGIFGASAKASSVIPNKVFQVLAAGCPIVTRASPAIKEIVADNPPSVYLVPPEDPHALAHAVTSHLAAWQAKQIPPAHHLEIAKRVAPAAIGKMFRNMIEQRITRP